MNTNYSRSIRALSKIIPYPNLKESGLFGGWRNRLLFFLLVTQVIAGTIAYVPSVILSLTEKLWAVAIIDTFIYLAVLYISFSRKLSANSKVFATIILFYVLGLALLILLGKDGAGFNWLFMFPILSSFFYGFRGANIATLVNFVTLVLITIPVYLGKDQIVASNYGIGGWTINAINFFALCTFISYALVIIIYNIDKSLKKEKKLSFLLKENKNKLAIEKDRAEESDRLKSTFLANMSHEIRTPMNSILGFSNLLSEPNITPETTKRYNSLIQMAGEQLMHIIDDIIDISKIELNQMKLKKSPVKIYSCLLEIIEIQQGRINSLQKDLVLRLDVPTKYRELVIESDEFRFKQIVNNLVGNAVKYTDSGMVKVGYSIQTREEQKVVEFFVKDTGRGIPKEAQEKVFDRFTQADNVGFSEGTGLGLSITKGLLHLLGGTIRLESTPNVGSNFYFTLPYIETEVVNTSKPLSVQVSDLSDKLIYIAEDDTYSYYYLSEMLKPTGAEIIQVTNGKELLDLLDKKLPDLVLLDINMPVMNGFKAIREIKKIHAKLPVIAQTAYAMAEEHQKCMDLGCDDYISKPIKKDSFFILLNKYLLAKK